jgi:hypothetical protein
MVTKVCKKMKVGKRQVTVRVHSVTSIAPHQDRCHTLDTEAQTKDKPDSDATNKYKSTRLLESWFLPHL